MTVAAARKTWLPALLGRVGHVFAKSSSSDDPSKTVSDAPRNALFLSSILSTLYILFGNFRALLTFNGLGEYSFFFLTTLGAIVLRFREPELQRPYKPIIFIPAIFVVVSGFVVVRGAIFAPVQAGILLVVWALGVAFYWIRKRTGGIAER